MAKALATVCILFAYLLLVVQPAIPFLHYTFQKDYYARVLCVNQSRPSMHCEGKCALRKQLARASNEQPVEAPSPAPEFHPPAPHCPSASTHTVWMNEAPRGWVQYPVSLTHSFSGLPEIPPPEFRA